MSILSSKTHSWEKKKQSEPGEPDPPRQIGPCLGSGKDIHGGKLSVGKECYNWPGSYVQVHLQVRVLSKELHAGALNVVNIPSHCMSVCLAKPWGLKVWDLLSNTILGRQNWRIPWGYPIEPPYVAMKHPSYINIAV